MFLGIEIGGTKLQVAAGKGDGSRFLALQRVPVVASDGAAGILASIERLALPLVKQHSIQGVGIGFGGPINSARGTAVKSHHVAGWDDFPLVDWSQNTFRVPAVLANDADAAGLAEARFGAGQGANPVFYITVGTGIGGGLILNRQIYCGSGGGAAELGHLRVGLGADSPDQILESFAAGWGIAAAAQARLAQPRSYRIDDLRASSRSRRPDDLRQRLIEVEEADEEDEADLLARCEGRIESLTTRLVGQAAAEGNRIALGVLRHAWQALGWGIAQMITLVAPQVVVIGGGVALMGEKLFFDPVRREVERYVFPPFAGSYQIVPASLGEEVVLHGALALASSCATI